MQDYEKLCRVYWVLAVSGQTAPWYAWLCASERPAALPGKNWRRPSYREALARQRAYNCNPAVFIHRCQGFSRLVRKMLVRQTTVLKQAVPN